MEVNGNVVEEDLWKTLNVLVMSFLSENIKNRIHHQNIRLLSIYIYTNYGAMIFRFLFFVLFQNPNDFFSDWQDNLISKNVIYEVKNLIKIFRRAWIMEFLILTKLVYFPQSCMWLDSLQLYNVHNFYDMNTTQSV